MSKSWRARVRAFLAGLVVPVSLICAVCVPTGAAVAGDGGASGLGGEASIAGGFALGDGLEATIDERDGAVRFEIPVGGLRLVWDSRDAADAFALGRGWGFGTGHVGVDGGVRVIPAGGGSYELDRSHPSGLAGFPTRAVTFDASPGELAGREGRPGGGDAPLPYVYVLRELGGTATYFDAAGRPVVRADGTRLEYDQLDRPVRETATDGDVRQITYWADGTRRGIADDRAGSVTFYWADETLVTEAFGEPGAPGGVDAGTASYLIGADRHARTVMAPAVGASTSYSSHDRHGNVTELTDATGEVTHSYSYSDYGRTTEHLRPDAPDAGLLARNPFRYAGEYTDSPGTQWLATRTYDADLARFEQPDPTARHNRYAFGDADPITNVDPSGHVAVSDLVNGFTAAAGLVFGALAVTSAVLTPGWIATVGFFGSRGFLAATGFVADVVGLGAAVVQFVDDHATRFLPRFVKTGLTYAEYGLMGLGAIGALAGSAPDLVAEIGRRRGPEPPNIADQLAGYAGDRTQRIKDFRKSPTFTWYRTNFGSLEAHATVIRDFDDTGLSKALAELTETADEIRLPSGGIVLPGAAWLKKTKEQVAAIEGRIRAARTAIVEQFSVADKRSPAARLNFLQLADHRQTVMQGLQYLSEAETSYLALQDLVGLQRLTAERAVTLITDD
jgi:RHS repeat-associated protein